MPAGAPPPILVDARMSEKEQLLAPPSVACTRGVAFTKLAALVGVIVAERPVMSVKEPLTELLKRHPLWRVLDDDGKAVLFARRPGNDLIPSRHSAELTYGGMAE